MDAYLKRSWTVIDLDNLAHNTGAVKKRLSPRTMLMCVVKADAYGHGDKYVAAELARLGADWFAVSNIEEAVSLREHGISLPILIFGVTPPGYAKDLDEYSLTQTVHSTEYARALNDAAKAAGVALDIHVKTDTGMSRIGFVLNDESVERSAAEILELSKYSHLNAKGIYTHFSCADGLNESSVTYTKAQYTRFSSFINRLEAQGLSFPVRHCCNSAATVLYPEMHMDMVRPGIILYGLYPGRDCAGKIDIKPVMGLYSAVSMVKEIAPGTSVGYSRYYTAERAVKVATVQIGYADGFGRELSSKGRMLVRGQYAQVIGRVCMDQIMLDVTHIDGVKEGDTVTIVGKDGNAQLTFDEMAELSDTLNYEKICLIGRRVPRVYCRDGREIAVADYVKGGWTC